MSVSPRIRRAASADLDGILDLERLFPGDRMSRAALRRFLRSDRAAIWVAVWRGCITGALVMLTRQGSRWARVYSLVVDPVVRGRGLGQRLVRTAEREAGKRGCTGMSLEVRTDNGPARALYARLGYREVATLPTYYDDNAPGVRLRKRFASL